MSRRSLARVLGHADESAGIPEARWMRAMTFERLVRDRRFVSQLLTATVGELGLERPAAIHRADAHVDMATTAHELEEAHGRALSNRVATIITGLAVPFVGMELEKNATPVKPDFAVVAARQADVEPFAAEGSWLIMGDAKDYERVRSRIDDQRLLKGFLQVALGAESAAEWSQLPRAMDVHPYGALAVPRNAFLQPQAIVERLDDHRREVRSRADERKALLAAYEAPVPENDLFDYVHHLAAVFDPAACMTCSLFNFCRNEVRTSTDPTAVLLEIGVRPEHRAGLMEFARTGASPEGVPASVVARYRATIAGLPEPTGQLRTDPVGEPGTVEVVLAKSDAAALGIHGVAMRRKRRAGTYTDWKVEVFEDPQSPTTRLQIMKHLGQLLNGAIGEQTANSSEHPGPVHLVVPDSVTADVLVSIADSLAGVETSRLRWVRDREMDRPVLTFDGEPAKIPAPLPQSARVAVSFLLEADRARAMILRDPIVDLRSVLAAHVVPGGPAIDAGRLDYLLRWAEATDPLDHRQVSDDVAELVHTPGARLANSYSDQVHEALRGKRSLRGRSRPKPARYTRLVKDELSYKQQVVERAVGVLGALQLSRLRPVYEALECDAQEVWRRRLRLHASDLVRFGRTSDFWRNVHVDILSTDGACAEQLQALGNPQQALDMAVDAGIRQVARATVISTDPLRVAVTSRSIGDGSCAVALHVDGFPAIESCGVVMKIQKGSFKFEKVNMGQLASDEDTRRGRGLRWEPSLAPAVKVGTQLILADCAWFKTFATGDTIAVARPATDTVSAPRNNCDKESYSEDGDDHRWCCRPHEAMEAEVADWLAERRARGELNPQTWPPVLDEDEFDVTPAGASTATGDAELVSDQPDPDLTIDDLD